MLNHRSTLSPLNNGSAGEELARNLLHVIHDAERMMRTVPADAGPAMASARDRLASSVQQARSDMSLLPSPVVERMVGAGRAANHYVRHHPWQAGMVLVAAGLAAGMAARQARTTERP